MQLLSKPAIATVGGIGLLAAGVGLGASESIPIGDIRSLHIAMASIFVALAPAIVYIHAKRFYRKGATDWVAWTHFVLLALLLFVAGKMYRRWAPSRTHNNLKRSTSGEPVIATYRGEKYNVTDFVPHHPGGVSNILKAADQDLEQVWAENGVGWHAKNKRVANVLQTRKI